LKRAAAAIQAKNLRRPKWRVRSFDEFRIIVVLQCFLEISKRCLGPAKFAFPTDPKERQVISVQAGATCMIRAGRISWMMMVITSGETSDGAAVRQICGEAARQGRGLIFRRR